MIAAARPDLIADLASGALTEALADIAEDAARVILPYWRTGTVATTKADDSPVTLADQQAEALILSRLDDLYPDVQAVAEEAVADGGAPAITGEWFWLIDPLDGTRGFVAGKESFTVNIALVRGNAVVAGVVTAPATSTTWRSGPHPDGGAFRRRFGEGWQAIKVRDRPARPVAVMSHSLTDEQAQRLASRHGCMDWQGTDSSLKFCLIAEGRCDAYPRTGPTSEWDTAAGQAVLEAAGGRVMAEDGTPFRYAKPGFLNGGFVAVGG
jgi:3'(2'), 5'-bisphosphate nucleotidase